MRIPEYHFEKFKVLMRKHFGDEKVDSMTEQELYEKASKLLRFVEIVITPDEEARNECGERKTRR
jgi:hypothetical protein